MTSQITSSVFPDNRLVDKADLREQFDIAASEITALQKSNSYIAREAFLSDMDENSRSGGSVSTTVLVNEGGTGATNVQEAVTNLQTTLIVNTLVALKALPFAILPLEVATRYRVADGDNGGGVWYFRSGDQSSLVTADTQSGLFAAPDSSPTGVNGVWVRKTDDQALQAAWFGMSPAGTAASNKTAIDAAMSLAGTLGGGVVKMSRGYFVCNNLAAPVGNNIQLEGLGEFGGTILSCAETTGNFITFSGWAYPAVRDIYLTSHVRRTAGFAIRLESGVFKPRIQNVRIDYHYNGIDVGGATGVETYDITCRYMIGLYGIRCYGTAGSPNTAVTINNLDTDNPPPGDNNAPVKAYTPSTAYNLDDTVTVNGKTWQCSLAGTTGGSSAPNAIPGSTGADAFTSEVTDGSAKWKFVNREGYISILVDSYTYSTVIDLAALLNGTYGLVMADTDATGTSHPIWLFCWDIETDHTILDGVSLLGGEGFYCNVPWFGSSRQGNGIVFGPSFHGEISLSGGRIAANWLHGISHYAGPIDVHVRGVAIGHNSVIGSGTCHGAYVGAGATEFSYVDNTMGKLAVTAWAAVPNNQGYGLVVDTGASDDYVIALNRMKGNVTAGLFDGGTGLVKYVPATGNPGV